MQTHYYIFDFDSTLTQVEAFDALVDITVKNKKQKEEILNKISQITNDGIDGNISFTESLERRLALLTITKDDIKTLVNVLRRKVSPSFKRNKDFFKKHINEIRIISAGFKEFIIPIVKRFGISASQVYANEFIFDKKGKVIGFDKENPLSMHNGKIEQVKKLSLKGVIHVIGDGYSDFVMKLGGADIFYAFTESVKRESAVKNADHVTPSLDEFLYVNKLPMSLSYPKSRITLYAPVNSPPKFLSIITKEGYSIILYEEKDLLKKEFLANFETASIIATFDGKKIPKETLIKNKRLLCLVCFNNDVNNLDLNLLTLKGVAVVRPIFNNTRAIAEFSIATMIMLLRNFTNKNIEMHQGIWDRNVDLNFEIKGKTLGIIGYGQVGTQLSVMADMMGINVLYYDIVSKMVFGNIQRANSMEYLLKKSDIISINVPKNVVNYNLIDKKEFNWMKNNVVILNFSGYEIFNENELIKNIKSHKIKGLAIDKHLPSHVKGNKYDSPLRGLKNVFLTPDIAWLSQEAEIDLSGFLANKIIDYINTGNSMQILNLPEVFLSRSPKNHRLLHIHKNVYGVLSQVNKVMAKYNINVLGQILKTNEKIGYLIIDIEKKYNEDVIKELKKIQETLKLRVLY